LVYRKGGKVWIYAEVFEMDLRNIQKGQAVEITATFLEGKTIAGVVASTDEVISPKTRTAKVRIEIKNSKRFRREYLKGIRSFRKSHEGRSSAYIVYLGNEAIKTDDDIAVLPTLTFLKRLHKGEII